jgi:hypothetical protein
MSLGNCPCCSGSAAVFVGSVPDPAGVPAVGGASGPTRAGSSPHATPTRSKHAKPPPRKRLLIVHSPWKDRSKTIELAAGGAESARRPTNGEQPDTGLLHPDRCCIGTTIRPASRKPVAMVGASDSAIAQRANGPRESREEFGGGGGGTGDGCAGSLAAPVVEPRAGPLPPESFGRPRSGRGTSLPGTNVRR